MTVAHYWTVHQAPDGSYGWVCSCGWTGDDYDNRDAAEDAAELHEERETD